jgi:hypothetical protein
MGRRLRKPPLQIFEDDSGVLEHKPFRRL